MFVNYFAGAVSLVLVISTFTPWVTVWFYSLNGIESVYGIVTLLAGLLGITVAGFQHLSGTIRGRGFILFSLLSLACETFYFRHIVSYGDKLNEIVSMLRDIFGDALMQKMQQLLGEQWAKILTTVLQRFGTMQSNSMGLHFVGGGLLLAVLCSLTLLGLGILAEKNKPAIE